MTPRLSQYLTAAVAMLIPVYLAGCGNAGDGRSVIEFWAMGREGEVVQELLPEFERRHPDVHVRVQQIPWSAAHEKLLTAYAGDAMPDLFQLGNTWIPEFVALRAVAPLDVRIAGSEGLPRAGYFAGIMDSNDLEGHLYGVPWYVDTRVIFYRKDIFEQAGVGGPPRNWAQWLDTMARIKARAGGRNYAILLPVNEWEAPVILALQKDAGMLRDGNRYGNFRSAAFRQPYTFYLDLFRRGLAPTVAGSELANLYQDFARGYFAMVISGPWNIGEFNRRLPASLRGKWATAPMPQPDDNHPGLSLAGGSSLSISRQSRHPGAAWELIEFLSEPAQQLTFFRLTGDLPARVEAWRDPLLADNPHAQAFRAQLEHVRAPPKIPEWERVASLLSRYTEAIVRGGMPIDTALTALDGDVDAMLEKRRWLLRRRLETQAP